MNSTNVYPGMCDGRLEIFLHNDGELKAIQNGQVIDFDKLKPEQTEFLHEIIEAEPETATILQQFFPNDQKAQIKKLAQCRFGGLNFFEDYNPITKEISHDIVDCPVKNTCVGCGIICKNSLNYNGQELSETELNAIALLSTSKKNFAVASELNMCEGTFNVFKTFLYKKLNIFNKPELTRLGVFLGVN